MSSKDTQMEQMVLSSTNLEQFNNLYGPSKDLLYSKIFLPPQKVQDQASNWGEEQTVSKDNFNKSFIISHSLFCYNTEVDDVERSSMLLSLKHEKKFGDNWGVTSEKQTIMRTPQMKPKQTTN
mmetsp:Transcript_12260/g.12067  ORF Transcript_12260/g.12067 Transcript_12260/m.12067 type:complete len:123 (-) Transcript_12260:529-897(-)